MEAFAAMEKTANIWSNKVRHKSISSIAGATKETQEALVARRAAFLRRAQKTEEEMALRKEKQRRAAAAVFKAVQAKENEHIVSRPLKRFHCKMVVAIIVHAYNPKTKVETDRRMMVVMDDQLKYEKLASWVHNVTGIDERKKLSFEYISHQLPSPLAPSPLRGCRNFERTIGGDGIQEVGWCHRLLPATGESPLLFVQHSGRKSKVADSHARIVVAILYWLRKCSNYNAILEDLGAALHRHVAGNQRALHHRKCQTLLDSQCLVL